MSEYNFDDTRLEQCKSTKPKKKKKGVDALYIRLPANQMKWIRDEAEAQNRTLTAVVNIMIDAAQTGTKFEKEQSGPFLEYEEE